MILLDGMIGIKVIQPTPESLTTITTTEMEKNITNAFKISCVKYR